MNVGFADLCSECSVAANGAMRHGDLCSKFQSSKSLRETGKYMQVSVFVDTHVHLHPDVSWADALDAAAKNFAEAAAGMGAEQSVVGVLMLSECHGFDRFRELNGEGIDATSRWKLNETEEPASRVCQQVGKPKLVIIAGRQVVTSERLEVLALGTDGSYPDGRPIRQTIEELLSHDAITVLPWGFGKWWLKRGRILDEVLASPLGRRIWLGDNAGRPRCLPMPRRLRRACHANRSILPGTDPLPIPGQHKMIGRFGLVLPKPLDMQHPIESIRGQLESSATPLRRYGCPVRTATFINNAIALRRRKHDSLAR